MPPASPAMPLRSLHCTILLLVSSCLIVLVSSHGHPPIRNASRRAHHHNCVHEAKISQFDDSVDAESLMVPQVLMPFESPSELATKQFLDVVGARRLRGTERTLAASASTTPFQPMRIVFDLSKLSSDPGYMCTIEGDVVQVDGQSYTCKSEDVLTAAKKDFLVTVLLKAIEDYFEGVLSVQRVMGNLIVKGISCSSTEEWACCARSIPSAYKTQGVADADFVLHVTGRPTTGATIAWALPCNIDQYGRPISGQANFGPGKIDPVSAAARSEQVGTALHEMTHALVFSRNRFYDFRQPLNGDLWGYNNVVAQSQGVGGIWVSKVVTPSVVKQIKRHYNCFNWVTAGIELENGDTGSADFSSHWEKRVLMNEYMTATSSYDPVYSSMTLALFEDSGWYQVSYANAQVLPWGYMEGCGLAQSRCSDWSSRYICSDSTQTGCTSDYTSKGYCNVAAYKSSIPAGFQYFQDPKFGGRDTYADYCPFYRAYSNGDCRGIGRLATYVDTNNYMEEVGPSSRCFQSSLSKYSSDTAALRSSCYKILGCTSESLRLSIGGKEVLCPLQGGEIRVSGYNGRVVCPVANRLCQILQDKCSGNGVLLATGACECRAGFVGSDCSGIACPKGSNGAECGGSSRGTCDYKTGKCTCTAAYTGGSCSDLVCPVPDDGKTDEECSGHGTCDRAYGQCKCENGYSGKACECVPGCTAAFCGKKGTCDCTTGACVCQAGYSGLDCAVPANPPITEIAETSPPITDTIVDKGYKFYKIRLSASSYDITFIVQYQNANGAGADVDLYGSFVDPYPSSLSAKATLFTSNYGSGDRDEIHLCGSLGVFPRGLNDTFRYCPRPTSPYVQETPGYFYLSVFGYDGGSFTLTIETDKCKDVDCSHHGACGVNAPGICTCDRYWSGTDCSVPKCGPDCLDLGTCTSSSLSPKDRLEGGDDVEDESPSLMPPMTLLGALPESLLGAQTTVITTASSALRNTSECYGNGVCQVFTDATSGRETPRCVCDEAFAFAEPTPAQALCKELVPSIAYIQHFAAPFAIEAELLDLQLAVNSWALYTIAIKPEWEIFVATLEILTAETDAMLFVRKEKLPSVSTTNQSQTAATFVQYMDSEGWTGGVKTRKVVLSRATSTLSTGLYYIGVYNSAYARSALGYRLTVNTTANCTTTDGGGFGICNNGGVCNALASPICTCPSAFAGKYCDLQATRSVLAPPPTTPPGSASDAPTATPAVASYVGFHTDDEQQLLGIGKWDYYSFDIADAAIKMVQFRLTIHNDLSGATPALPLLLVRGPADEGFPSLLTESQQDFAGIAARHAEQVVSLRVDQACSRTSSPHRDCYKVAIHNRQYAGATLEYDLEVELFTSVLAAFSSPTCGADGDRINCNDHGKCLMLASTTNTTTTPLTAVVPSCACRNGWTGLQCNSPKAFDLPQLWSAIGNVSLLCTACASDFTLSRGELKMFRVPQTLRENSGVRLRVTAVTAAGDALVGGPSPNVYVSEMAPRSIYDFTHISAANASDGASSSGTSQVVQLANASLSGHYWVVVFSDYPTSADQGLELSTTRRRLATTSRVPGRRPRQHLVQGRGLTDATPAVGEGTYFRLEAELYDLPADATTGTLLTRRSFTREVFQWLLHTPFGIAVFVVSLLFLVLVVGFCLWRTCRAPENQDKTTRRFFGRRQRPGPAAAATATGGAREHRPATHRLRGIGLRGGPTTAHVSDIELRASSDADDSEHAGGVDVATTPPTAAAASTPTKGARRAREQV